MDINMDMLGHAWILTMNVVNRLKLLKPNLLNYLIFPRFQGLNYPITHNEVKCNQLVVVCIIQKGTSIA
jgi:hypothetical protein